MDIDVSQVDFGKLKRCMTVQERLEAEQRIVAQLAQDIPNMIGRLASVIADGGDLGMDMTAAKQLLGWIEGGLSGAVAAGAAEILKGQAG